MDKLIEQEMLFMMENMLTKDLELISDSSLKLLGISQKKFKKSQLQQTVCHPYAKCEFNTHSLKTARNLVEDEYKSLMSNIDQDADFERFQHHLDSLNENILLSKCTSLSHVSGSELNTFKSEYNYLRNVMTCFSQKVVKNQTKLQILVGGYQVFL